MSIINSVDSLPCYDDDRTAKQILFETRELELKRLRELTGEIAVNEFKPGFVRHLEDVA